LALGLHLAGFHPTAVVENDADCCATLRANASNGLRHTAGWPVEEASVVGFDYSRMPRPSLVSAGAPCQPFSVGGRARGRWDERNLFPEVIRALAVLQPEAFLVENVQGLLFPRMMPYFEGLLRELRHPRRSAGFESVTRGRPRDEYRVSYRVLNAADYGLPQARKRLFIAGLRRDLAEAWTWPTPSHSRTQLIVELLGDEYWERHEVRRSVIRRVRDALPPMRTSTSDAIGKPWRTLRDLIASVGEPAASEGEAADRSHVFVPGARVYHGHSGSRLDWPAKTVKAGVHGCPGGEHILVRDDGSVRYLTVRECALLQGFPADYALPSLRRTAMRQIGNAVPVPVAAAVGQQVAEVLASGRGRGHSGGG
jgi:DNA (cytosine-5)-methyltransferase 1